MKRYSIVPERSRLWIDARSSLHPIHAVTDGLEGYLEMDADGDGEPMFGEPPVGKLSLAVSRLSSGNALEDRELQRRIDAKRFPTIDGMLTRAERVDGTGRHRVSGDLAFRGVARECHDELTVEIVDDRTVRLEGQATFDIRDFGMEPPKILLLKVEPEVAVRIEVIAELDG